MKTNYHNFSINNNLNKKKTIAKSNNRVLLKKTFDNIEINDQFWEDCLNNPTEKLNNRSYLYKKHKQGCDVNMSAEFLSLKSNKNDLISKSRNILHNQLKQSLSLPINHISNQITEARNKNKIYLKKETQNDKSTRTRSQEKCHLLYEKGKIKNEFTRLAHQNTDKARDQAELKECTFRPRINRKTNNKHSLSIEGSFYDRSINWKKINQEKIELEKVEKKKNEDKHSFKPLINIPKKEVLFNPKKNINKENKVTKKFIDRLVNARNETHKKKEMLNNLGRVNNIKNSSFIKNSMMDSFQKSSNYDFKIDDAMKNLRFELHNLKLDDDEE